MPELRFFTIPDNSLTEWNPDIHGKEIENEGTDPEDCVAVGWEPGRYEFSIGACLNRFVILVPEVSTRTYPQQAVLKGFDAFLKYTLDEISENG